MNLEIFCCLAFFIVNCPVSVRPLLPERATRVVRNCIGFLLFCFSSRVCLPRTLLSPPPSAPSLPFRGSFLLSFQRSCLPSFPSFLFLTRRLGECWGFAGAVGCASARGVGAALPSSVPRWAEAGLRRPLRRGYEGPRPRPTGTPGPSSVSSGRTGPEGRRSRRSEVKGGVGGSARAPAGSAVQG